MHRPVTLSVVATGLLSMAIPLPLSAQTATSTTTATSPPQAPTPAGARVRSAPTRGPAPTRRTSGPNTVKVHKDTKGYKLMVDGRPLMVYGMNWGYMPIGQNYNYNFWGQPEDVIKDALHKEMSLMQEMGVNVVRQYVGVPPKWIQYIYEKYGIYTALNHAVARYGYEVDGVYMDPTNYADARLRETVKEDIRRLVAEFKDTPGLIMWLLGNENNYGLYWSGAETEDVPEAQRGDVRATYLYSLMGEITDEIKAADSNHPVAIANGDLGFIDVIAKEIPNLDIFGSNVYRGRRSGALFEDVEKKLGVPFMYTEFGSDAYDAKNLREDGVSQADYLISLWQEIYEQSHGKGMVGNAIGGLIFQWSDGWWKYKQDVNLEVHDNNASWENGAYKFDHVEGRNNMNEEWFGICAKGPNDARGIYEVYPRAAYYALREAFKLDPYEATTTMERIRQHYGSLEAKEFQEPYLIQSLKGDVEALKWIRLINARIDLRTFSTGGNRLLPDGVTPDQFDRTLYSEDNQPLRNRNRFDHQQSFYFGVEVNPASNLKANVTFNALGNVAQNPIDEIFFENRGLPITVQETENGRDVLLSDVQRFRVYQAEFEWITDYAEIKGYYRTGHTHWGYEGDFFGMYPSAFYGSAIDTFNADAPNGIEITGRGMFEGLKLAFGDQITWGANPTIIGKYYRKYGNLRFSLMHQEDIAQRGTAGTSSAIPVPQARRSSVYLGYKTGPWDFEIGGIMAGSNFVDRSYVSAEQSDGAGYLNSGFNIYDDSIRWADTLGAKAKIKLTLPPFYWYLQGGYRGLVADGGPDETTTFTGWGLKESGQGNHWAVSSGAAFQIGRFQIGPNFLAQKPLEGPLPLIDAQIDPATGRLARGVIGRNQLQDPFWVRSNRETYGAELLIAFDPTPATWMWAWNNLVQEDAPLAAALDISYRHHPTFQDAGIGVAGPLDGGFTFAFPTSAPAQDLWDVSLRTIANFDKNIRWVNWAYAGNGQANGDDDRLVYRFGTYGRLDIEKWSVDYMIKFNDWGPYDYYRDFNFTLPLQTRLDVSYNLIPPKWFMTAATRLGVSGKLRFLDRFSQRFSGPSTVEGLFGGGLGNEWEVMTYATISL